MATMSRRKLLRFSQMQQERLDNAEMLLLTLAVQNGGELNVSGASLLAAQDALTDGTHLDYQRTADGGIRITAVNLVLRGVSPLAPKEPELEIISVEA
jgi:hypothetical protein